MFADAPYNYATLVNTLRGASYNLVVLLWVLASNGGLLYEVAHNNEHGGAHVHVLHHSDGRGSAVLHNNPCKPAPYYARRGCFEVLGGGPRAWTPQRLF